MADEDEEGVSRGVWDAQGMRRGDVLARVPKGCRRRQRDKVQHPDHSRCGQGPAVRRRHPRSASFLKLLDGSPSQQVRHGPQSQAQASDGAPVLLLRTEPLEGIHHLRPVLRPKSGWVGPKEKPVDSGSAHASALGFHQALGPSRLHQSRQPPGLEHREGTPPVGEGVNPPALVVPGLRLAQLLLDQAA